MIELRLTIKSEAGGLRVWLDGRDDGNVTAAEARETRRLAGLLAAATLSNN